MADASSLPTPEDRTRYEALKKELMQALPKRRALDKQLAQIEFNIYNLEASYLTETAVHSGGNIIQGFEGYLKNQNTTRKRYEVNDHDRIFSKSSLTYQKSLDLIGEGEDSVTATNDDYKQTSTVPATVVLPPATRTQEMSIQQKRVRDKEYQRRKRASVSLRSTGESEEEVSTSSRRANKRARIADDD